MATNDGRRTAQSAETYHDRRLARRMGDPAFRAEFERELAQIRAVDEVVHQLDELRAAQGLSKAALARAIDKQPAAVRRLLTASGNPELKTVVAMAQALDADLVVVPRRRDDDPAGATSRRAPA